MSRMADSIASSQNQEITVGTSTTITTVVSTDAQDSELPTLHLKLKKPKTGRKVQWTEETVDNECLNRRKSKCCCIYKKPKDFGESSSSEDDSDDECDHCKGHADKKKTKNSVASTPTENGDSCVVTETLPPIPSNENPKIPEDHHSSHSPPS